MTNDMSFLSLVLEASLIVQLVMLALLLASIASWAVILRKRGTVRQAQRSADRFETEFWSGGDLSAMYRRISGRDQPAAGMEGIFEAGFREFGRLREQDDITPGAVLEGCRRAMGVSQMREADRLEQNLAMLATVGSTSPYVGLFGTVWGIVNAFQSIAMTQNTSLTAVAPGIAEALVATAFGLVAAIPAVVAYNKFTSDLKRMAANMEQFSAEFLNIISRHIKE